MTQNRNVWFYADHSVNITEKKFKKHFNTKQASGKGLSRDKFSIRICSMTVSDLEDHHQETEGNCKRVQDARQDEQYDGSFTENEMPNATVNRILRKYLFLQELDEAKY